MQNYQVKIYFHGGIKQENTKIKIRSPDGDTDDFDIVAGVLQEDTLTPVYHMLRLHA